MSEQRKATGTMSAWITTIVVLLPVIYVLSVGPAAWLNGHGYIPLKVMPAVASFYEPIRHLEGIPVVDPMVRWYVSFFE